jgi:hypothetical protein
MFERKDGGPAVRTAGELLFLAVGGLVPGPATALASGS